MKYYSQNDEEWFIGEFFGSFVGRFLDVGAFDGIDMSNTRRLWEQGWSGVLVEPAAHNFSVLIKNYESRPNDAVLVQAAVSNTRGLKKFWIDCKPQRLWSTTISPDLVDIGSIAEPLKIPTVVACCTIDDLVPYGPYDFISIDAEWEDLGILRTMPASLVTKCRLLCIEPRNDEQRAEMTEILKGIGFVTCAYQSPENLFVQRPV